VPIVVILALFIGWAAWKHIRAMPDATMNDAARG